MADQADIRRLHASHVTATRHNESWQGSAFILEALLLFVFLVGSLAVVTNLIGDAHMRSTQANRLSCAITLATNDAEAFAADPRTGSVTSYHIERDGKLPIVPLSNADEDGVFTLVRTVTTQDTTGGTLYNAHITVTQGDETAYELDTSRYVSDGGKAGADAGADAGAAVAGASSAAAGSASGAAADNGVSAGQAAAGTAANNERVR